MNSLKFRFDTKMTVAQCEQKFRESVQSSCGAGRRVIGVLSGLRGNGSGIEFFQPTGGPVANGRPTSAWQGGAFVPGHSMMHGVTRMAVHIFVVDNGDTRTVHLVGPYGMGDKGSTSKLLQSVAHGFGANIDAGTL